MSSRNGAVVSRSQDIPTKAEPVSGRFLRPEDDRKSAEPASGQEWETEAPEYERIDDRDLENIDLDIECLNEALERKARR